MQPHDQINHTDVNEWNVLTNVTLASSNCTLPDDGDNTETYWSCFNVNFNILLNQLFCSSVGNKTFDWWKTLCNFLSKIEFPFVLDG
jgi:hypothetical protein